MPILFTIGYQGLEPDALVAALTQAGVSTVADVRAKPHSRKPGFSGRGLNERLEGEGIGYVGLKGLGSPEAARDLGHAGDVAGMRRAYGGHLETAAAAEDYAALKGLALDEDVCLLCFEADPNDCHRLVLAEKLAADTGLPVRHLKPLAEGRLL
jgi:uncharacterized protein (DUF488 family)